MQTKPTRLYRTQTARSWALFYQCKNIEQRIGIVVQLKRIKLKEKIEKTTQLSGNGTAIVEYQCIT